MCARSRATRYDLSTFFSLLFSPFITIVITILYTEHVLINILQDFVLSVCLTPDGQWVMSGSKDRGVQFWDPNTGVAQMMLQGHKNSGKPGEFNK